MLTGRHHHQHQLMGPSVSPYEPRVHNNGAPHDIHTPLYAADRWIDTRRLEYIQNT